MVFPSSLPPHSRYALGTHQSGAQRCQLRCQVGAPELRIALAVPGFVSDGDVFSPDFIGNSSGDHRNFMGISEYFLISDISYDMT